MTKEEILVMEAGANLDALIVERVFGWRIGHKEWESSRLNYDSCPWVDSDGHWHRLLKCSTDISAAWQVLRKLREEYWCIEIKIADGCRVIMELLRTPAIRVEINAGTPFEKLPEAICKAALLAKLQEKEEK